MRGYDPAPPNWRVLTVVVAMHAALAAALLLSPVSPLRRPHELRLEVFDVRMATPPPPPETPKTPVPPRTPSPVVPFAIVQATLPPQAPILAARTDPQPAPPAPPHAEPAPAPPAPPKQVSRDLIATVLSAVPPRYPVASRRAHEEGTVVLDVEVGVDGRVADIAIRHSSGSARLDEAALNAVRHWRWFPTLVAGQAVAVRGLVEIPFILSS